MKTCKICGIEKSLDNYYKSPGSIGGYHHQCKQCIKLKSDMKKLTNPPVKKVKSKPSKPGKIQYRKMKSLINPVNPIPLKLTTIDGFGGYYRFDVNKVKQQISYAKSHGQKNHMVNRKFKCWQVKDTNEIAMRVFCDTIGMSRKAIIKFEKPDKTVYVVNLFNPGILELMR